MPRANNQGRFVEEAGAIPCLAARDEFGTRVGHRAADEPLNPVALAFGDERAKRRRRVARVTHAQIGDGLRNSIDQSLLDSRLNIDARCGGAVLAGVVISSVDDRFGRRVDVRIIEDDYRRLAAELEMGPLDRRRDRFHDFAARRDVAGQ